MDSVVVPVDVLVGRLLLHEIRQYLEGCVEQDLVLVVPTRAECPDSESDPLGVSVSLHVFGPLPFLASKILGQRVNLAASVPSCSRSKS